MSLLSYIMGYEYPCYRIYFWVFMIGVGVGGFFLNKSDNKEVGKK